MKARLGGVSHLTLLGLLLIALTSCGGGGSDGFGAMGGGAMYTIGGTVTGLVGSGLVLQNNGGGDLTVCTDCSFTFTAEVANGAAYAVTVKTQPSSPVQNCVVASNGSGTVDGASVTDIAVVCFAGFAYAANGGDNTISAYSIDSATGALSAVGTPVPAGTSPSAIAARPDGQYVYVVNESSNNISVYAVNATSGALSEILGSPFAAGTDPKALTFDSSGAYLYVANNGSDNLSAYAVDASTGALTPQSIPTYTTGSGPSAVSVGNLDSGQFLYVANNGGSNDISVFAITAGTGALTPVAGSPFAAGGNPHSLVLQPYGPFDGGAVFLYTANFDGSSSTISGFSVDTNTGALTAVGGSPFAVSVSNSITTDRTGSYLYVTTAAGVVGYSIDASTGSLSALPGFPVASGTNPYAMTVDGSNQFLYVANEGAASISAYELDAADGALTVVSGSAFAAGNLPDSLAIL